MSIEQMQLIIQQQQQSIIQLQMQVAILQQPFYQKILGWFK